MDKPVTISYEEYAIYEASKFAPIAVLNPNGVKEFDGQKWVPEARFMQLLKESMQQAQGYDQALIDLQSARTAIRELSGVLQTALDNGCLDSLSPEEYERAQDTLRKHAGEIEGAK